jgi:hypothetical protein
MAVDSHADPCYAVDMNVVKNLKKQLQYARNGHAVLRQLITDKPDTTTLDNSKSSPTKITTTTKKETNNLLTGLRETMVSYTKEHELEVWQHKVSLAVKRDGARNHVPNCRHGGQMLALLSAPHERAPKAAASLYAVL